MMKRAVIATLQPFVADRVYVVRHGLAKGLKRRGGLGFVPQVGRLSLEETFLEGLDLAGQTVYDIGGYEGVFTLFFARRVGPSGRVVTFEPNPRNYERIVENVRLNGFSTVDVRQVGVGVEPGVATLVFPSDETARGSMVTDIQQQILQERDVQTIDVLIDSLDHQIALGVPEPDFVKIDVEGLELDVLRGMIDVIARRRPALYIELHGADLQRKLENATRVMEFLWSAGYSPRHVESNKEIDRPAAVPPRGHIYCRG
jgi:FkbM family methyltransferase